MCQEVIQILVYDDLARGHMRVDRTLSLLPVRRPEPPLILAWAGRAARTYGAEARWLSCRLIGQPCGV